MSVQSIANNDCTSWCDPKIPNKNDPKSLVAVARKNEGYLLQSMLKSMRMEQHFLSDSSPFAAKAQLSFQDMLEVQFASMADLPVDHLRVNEEKKSIDNAPATSAKSSLLPPDNHSRQNAAPSTLVDDFVQSIWPKAKQAAALIGLDPKILIAQAALETGWGKLVAKDSDGSSSNNLFNIKTGSSSNFASVTTNTTEYSGNAAIKINDSFRKYVSVEQSFNDYVSLIKGSDRYQYVIASAANPERYVQELYKAGYATDPQYAQKILSIYHGEQLNQAMVRCGL